MTYLESCRGLTEAVYNLVDSLQNAGYSNPEIGSVFSNITELMKRGHNVDALLEKELNKL
jgi:hypothetical protein